MAGGNRRPAPRPESLSMRLAPVTLARGERSAELLRRTSERGERLIRTLSESFHGKKPVVPAICVLPERLGVLEFQELLDLQVLLVDLRDLQEIPVRLVRKGSKE